MKKYVNSGANRMLRHKTDRIERQLRKYRPTKALPVKQGTDTLRIIPLGGQNGIGEKNMIVLEYGDDALILDCGFELGIALPGINYAIPVADYLETIRHKIKGYIISHGHMDHIGALAHIVPQYPAPIFGSRFTMGMVAAQFEKLQESDALVETPEYHVLDMDSHERVQLGSLTVELVRVTHAIPESSAIVVDTPVGRVINTGDFRLDPEPLDDRPSDTARLKELGDEGVLLLMSESTNTTKPGRTPTEHTLQDSFYELMEQVNGRLITAVFSTNMNRVQMIIDAAHHYGRKVALDGRSMIATAELAVRLGTLKIPKGTLVTMRHALTLPDKEVVIICTGGQGEPGAALSRMAAGEHQQVKLRRQDSVVISSTPIPGNEQSYAEIANLLAIVGVKQYRHPTHEIDGCGPLHVSGHASRDEHAEMIQLTRPRFLMPIYGGPAPRMYHQQIGREQGIAEKSIIMADNGAIIELTPRTFRIAGKITSGSRLVDQNGTVVPEIVTKDRLMLQDNGFMVVVLTVGSNARLLTSPDILTRGHISVQENGEVMDELRQGIKKLLASRTRLKTRADIDLLKHELRDMVAGQMVAATTQTPIIIPVVNLVASKVPHQKSFVTTQ